MASTLRTALETPRGHHGARVRSGPLDLSRILQEKHEYVMGMRGQQRSVINFVSRPACKANCVISVLPPMPVFIAGGSRQSVNQKMSLHEDSSGHRNIMRVSV